MTRHDVKHNADGTFWARVHVVGQAAPSGGGSGDEGGPGEYVMLVTKDGVRTLIHNDGASEGSTAAAEAEPSAAAAAAATTTAVPVGEQTRRREDVAQLMQAQEILEVTETTRETRTTSVEAYTRRVKLEEPIQLSSGKQCDARSNGLVGGFGNSDKNYTMHSCATSDGDRFCMFSNLCWANGRFTYYRKSLDRPKMRETQTDRQTDSQTNRPTDIQPTVLVYTFMRRYLTYHAGLTLILCGYVYPYTLYALR
jgi:hypothetical protein